ncbi:hypothetical protein YPPY66_2976, partial [Yersinia pestis PY-66]
MLALRQFVL